MSDYTPTTSLMRAWYVRADHDDTESRAEYGAEFDRWLAGHNRKIHDQALVTVRNTLAASNAVTVAGALKIIDKMRGVNND